MDRSIELLDKVSLQTGEEEVYDSSKEIDAADRQKKLDNKKACTLIQQMTAGSEQALAEFYRSFESSIYAFALSRLNDPGEAADILQEVMLAIWRGASRFESRAGALTWVLSITNHKVIDRFRAKGQHKMEELNPEFPEEPIQSLEEMVNQKQQSKHLRKCLEKLSDAHRQVVHLAFFEDISQKEISEIVNCPEGTVRARMFHAKRALKRCLENIGIGNQES